MRKTIFIISLGLLNVIHGSLHLIQFLQSIIMIGFTSENSYIETILHNPFFTFLFGFIGLLTLTIGIKDFIHHRKCETK